MSPDESSRWAGNEEAFFRTLVETTGTAIVLIEEDRILSYVNGEFERLFGYTKAEVEGKMKWTSMVDPVDLSVMSGYHVLRRRDPASPPSRYEFKGITKSGGSLSLLITIELVPGTLQSVASLIDITDQKKTEAEAAWLARIAEENPNPVIRVSKEGKILYANPAGLPLLPAWGVEEEGNLPPDEQVKLREVFERGEVKEVEMYAGEALFSLTLVPVPEEGYLNVYGLDITGRKRMLLSLEESETRFRELFTHIQSGIAVYKPIGDGSDFVIVDFNAAAEEIDGLRREDVIGRLVRDVFPGIAEMGLYDLFRRVWKTGVPERLSVAEYRDERIEGWRDNAVFRLPSGDIVAVFQDITAAKMAEKALQESEEKFRGLAERSTDLILLVGPDDVTEYASPASERILGYLPEEIIGHSAEDFIAEYEIKKIQGAIKRNREGECVESIDVTVIGKDGAPVYFEGSGSPVIREGEYMGLQVILHDITEKKAAEEAIRASEERYRTLVEASPYGIVVADADGRITFVNPQAVFMGNFSGAGDMEGKDLFMMVPEQERSRLKEMAERQLAGESLPPEGFTIVRKDGSFYEGEVRSARICISSKETSGILIIVRDVTAEKILLLQKSEAFSQIENNMEQLATLNDHIRNPLQVIVGLALLEGGDLAEKISAQAEEIDAIINRLDNEWTASEKTREFLRKHYDHGEEI